MVYIGTIGGRTIEFDRGRIWLYNVNPYTKNKAKFDRGRMVSIDTIGGRTVEFDLHMEVEWCQLTP